MPDESYFNDLVLLAPSDAPDIEDFYETYS